MFEKLLSLIAPHHCVGCGTTDRVLCETCIDVMDTSYEQCFVCDKTVVGCSLCAHCGRRNGITGAWIAGTYDGMLQKAIYEYKFERVRAAHRDLAELLDARLPFLNDVDVVTTVPTVPAHVRQRGYDHACLLARELSRRRGLRYEDTLLRRRNTRQLGRTRRERMRQADDAFAYRTRRGDVVPRRVLIVDDVITSGATMLAAARQLRTAGVDTVYCAAVAYKQLDH